MFDMAFVFVGVEAFVVDDIALLQGPAFGDGAEGIAVGTQVYPEGGETPDWCPE
jgi:hypothetical protein